MCNEVRMVKPKILLLGPFSGSGREILTGFSKSLRSLNFTVCTVAELYPLPKGYTPEQVREASHRALSEVDAAIFVFLLPSTLGVDIEERDLYGGVGVERGMADELRRIRAGYPLLAYLFDGSWMRSWLSSLLRSSPQEGDLEYVVDDPGNLEGLFEGAVSLCFTLEERFLLREERG
jgi:hypothetical protein